jgi:hypothetical protein
VIEHKEVKLKGVYSVYIKGNRLAITGEPYENEDEDGRHSCDQMGCPSVEHILIRATITERSYDAELQEEIVK